MSVCATLWSQLKAFEAGRDHIPYAIEPQAVGLEVSFCLWWIFPSELKLHTVRLAGYYISWVPSVVMASTLAALRADAEATLEAEFFKQTAEANFDFREREEAARKIQACIRGYTVRAHFQRYLLQA